MMHFNKQYSRAPKLITELHTYLFTLLDTLTPLISIYPNKDAVVTAISQWKFEYKSLICLASAGQVIQRYKNATRPKRASRHD